MEHSTYQDAEVGYSPAPRSPYDVEARPVRLVELSTRNEPPAQVLRREGELWTICYGGRFAQLTDLLGLHYIVSLLRHPYHEFHALELVRLHNEASEGPPASCVYQQRDLGDWLDAKAKAAYRQQLLDLRAELEDARAHNDLGQIEELERQMHFFAREIARSVGLFGRSRRSNSIAERARVNVSRAISSTIRRLRTIHASAGEHFDRSVKTGTFCSYRPDPRSRRPWEV